MLIVDNLSVTKHWPGVHKGHTMYQCRITMYVSLQDENIVRATGYGTSSQQTNYVALHPGFPINKKFCKQQKAGQGLGTRLWIL